MQPFVYATARAELLVSLLYVAFNKLSAFSCQRTQCSFQNFQFSKIAARTLCKATAACTKIVPCISLALIFAMWFLR